MCGIVAYMSNKTEGFIIDHKKLMNHGILIDTLRGDHSTGLAYVDKKGHVDVFKKALAGPDFIELKRTKKIIDDIRDYDIMIAHNRWATKGSINSNNAHPFQHGSITGVHNGSLTSYSHLAPKQSFDTDSEHIMWALANTKDSGDVIKDLRGAFTLVWHDAADNTLHIVRNEERPFSITYVEGENTLFGMSERDMIKMLATHNKIKIEEIIDIPVGEEWVFNLENVREPVKIKRELYTPPPTQTYHQQNAARGNQSRGRWKGNTYVTRQYEQEQLLKEYDLRVDEEIYFTINSFEPYASSSRNLNPKHVWGKVSGWMSSSPWLEVEVNGVCKEKFDALTSWVAAAEIIRLDDALQDPVLVLNYSTLRSPNKRELRRMEKMEEDRVASDREDGDIDDAFGETLYVSADGTTMNTKQAEDITKEGCGMCGVQIDLKDISKSHVMGNGIVCNKCHSKMTGPVKH